MVFKINLNPKIVKLKIPDKKEKVDIKYPLIEPFAFAHIYFEKSKVDLIYQVEEPKLNTSEKRIFKLISQGLKDLLFIRYSEFENIEDAIKYLEDNVKFIIDELHISLSNDTYNKIMYYIYRDFIGYGRIEPLMHDPFIEDIECSGVKIPVYVSHRYFGNLETNIIFNKEEEIQALIEKFALRCKHHVSYAEPLLDATLPDGSRINATYTSDVTTRGPTFTIRKFRKIPWSIVELVNLKTVTPEILAYLWLCVEYKRNFLIIGGTAAGKTTMLNAIASFIPPNARIVSIEDTREINLIHKNWIPAVARYSDDKSREITMFDLLKESFRQHPDYIIVGEIRGEEAYVLFQGMASGHAALSTMHATSVEALIERLTTPPINLPRVLVNLLDVVILMQHDIEDGKNIRRVKEVSEIINYDRYNKAFLWDPFNKRYIMNKMLYNLYKISKEYGIKLQDLLKEWNLRRLLIYTLVKMNIKNYFEVSKIIHAYYLDKEYVLKKFLKI